MKACRQPNIVFLIWHDAGDWFGCYGHETVQTPNVDRLAREGVRFAGNFSACAICSPSRAAMMTGAFCQHNGVMTLTNTGWDNRIYPEIPHLGARLKEKGYTTAVFGVVHEAAHEHVQEVIRPDQRFATDPWPNAEQQIPYVRKWISERARDGRPFYAQIGTYEAHLGRFFSDKPPREDENYPPVQDTEKGLAEPGYLVGSEADQACIATLQGLLRRGDRLVGALLDALAENGLDDNTLIVMGVDHGPGLARAKGTCYGAGTRTAWIMRWPGVIRPGQVVTALTTHVDVAPTVLSLLGHLDDAEDFDGLDFASHARGEDETELHDYIFSHMVESHRSVRDERYRLIRNFRPCIWSRRKGNTAAKHSGYPDPYPEMHVKPKGKPKPTETDTDCWNADIPLPHLELYDDMADPDNLNDLAMDPAHAATLRRLDDRLWQFLFDSNDFVIHEPVCSEWQAETRHQLEAWCERAQRPAPWPEGPLANPIDAASAKGKTYDTV